MKDHIVERHYYDESIMTKVGTIAEKKLGMSLVYLIVFNISYIE